MRVADAASICTHLKPPSGNECKSQDAARVCPLLLCLGRVICTEWRCCATFGVQGLEKNFILNPAAIEESVYQALRDNQSLADERAFAWEMLQVPESSRDQAWTKRVLSVSNCSFLSCSFSGLLVFCCLLFVWFTFVE